MVTLARIVSLFFVASVYTGCSQLNYALSSARSPCAAVSSSETAIDKVGSGTLSDRYVICTAAQFANLPKAPIALSSSFLLGQDIDLAFYDGSTSARTLSPIGIYDYVTPANSLSFSGHFDGGGHILSNIKLVAVANQGVGLFASTVNASISNLKLNSINISGDQYVGGLVANNKSSTLQNIQVTGSLRATGAYVGGLVGNNDGSGAGANASIDSVITNVAILANDRSGGLIGWNDAQNGGRAAISNILVQGTLGQSLASGNSNGGAIGYNIANAAGVASLKNVVVTGNVTMTADGCFSGGVVGTNVGNGAGTDASLTNLHMRANFSDPASCSFALLMGGGVLGLNSCGTQANCHISQSSFEGVFTIASFAGGASGFGALVGDIQANDAGTDCGISDSSTSGILLDQNASSGNIGALIGSMGNHQGGTLPLIVRSYSSMQLIGVPASQGGGIIGGVADNPIYVQNAFWNSDFISVATPASQASIVVGGAGLTTSAMMHAASFTGFDFSNVWSISEGTSSPRLR